MPKRCRFANFGSISSGTMRPEDLIPCFAWELEHLAKEIGGIRKWRKLLAEADKLDNNRTLMIEYGDDVVQELAEALESYAPPYAYFGAHPGDGADYGFWLLEDFEQYFDGLKVNDTSEVPKSYSGEVLHVSDHGNPTLYSAAHGRLREIWSLV